MIVKYIHSGLTNQGDALIRPAETCTRSLTIALLRQPWPSRGGTTWRAMGPDSLMLDTATREMSDRQTCHGRFAHAADGPSHNPTEGQ